MQHPRRVRPDGLVFLDWTAPDGWRLRSFRFDADQPRGSLLFLGGRGDFVEKYLEALVHWQARGWSIAGLDWRGQGGSGRLLADPLVCHSNGLDALLDDLDAFASNWAARAPAPRIAVAHSMGAHLLLRLALDRSPRLDGLVLLAPMFGIATGPLPPWLLPGVTRAAHLLGRSNSPIYRRGDRFKGVTSCPDRHADKLWWKAEHPELASGPPSWGWLHAALASIDALKASLARTTLDLPALIIAARADPIVDPSAVARVAARCPRAQLHLVDDAGHELLREADAYRQPVMAMIDRFLDTAAEPTSADAR